jgi:hypothetical protein
MREYELRIAGKLAAVNEDSSVGLHRLRTSHSDSHLAALYAEERWECLNGADVARLCISNEGRLSLPHVFPYQIQSLRRRHVGGRLLVVSCKDIRP